MNYTLITGASSGIGYELAKIFAKNGHNLILISRNESKLVEIKHHLEQGFNIKIRVITKDLSKDNSALEIIDFINQESISINYLINNAGYYIKGSFIKTELDQEANLIQLQCLTHTQLIKFLLPAMLKNKKGGILNVASTGSFVPGPYNAIYCAAKSFVLSFSEALNEELSNTHINVTALCPGGTNTAFHISDTKRNTFLSPLMEPSKVAHIGYNALMKGKSIAIPGFINRIQVFAVRFLPRNIVVKLTGKMVKN